MTTGKHSDLQTLQNPDGTFELVVAGDHNDEWSEVEEPRPSAAPAKRRIPWKPMLLGLGALALVGGVVSSVVSHLRAGVEVGEDPLPMVTGFKPYTGGASAGLGAGAKRASSPRPSVPVPNDDEEWADEEETGREVVVERGEPVIPTPPNEEVIESPEETTPQEVAAETHEPVPSVPNIPTDPQQIQRNLSRQLRTVNGDRVNFPLAKPNLGGVLAGENMPPVEPVMEDPEGEPEQGVGEAPEEETGEPEE